MNTLTGLLSGALGVTFYMLAFSYGQLMVTAGCGQPDRLTPSWTALAAATILKEQEPARAPGLDSVQDVPIVGTMTTSA